MIITFPRFCFWPPRTEKKKQKQKMAEMKLSIRREEGGPHSRTQAVGPFCNQTDGDGGGRKGGSITTGTERGRGNMRWRRKRGQ